MLVSYNNTASVTRKMILERMLSNENLIGITIRNYGIQSSKIIVDVIKEHVNLKTINQESLMKILTDKINSKKFIINENYNELMNNEMNGIIINDYLNRYSDSRIIDEILDIHKTLFKTIETYNNTNEKLLLMRSNLQFIQMSEILERELLPLRSEINNNIIPNETLPIETIPIETLPIDLMKSIMSDAKIMTILKSLIIYFKEQIKKRNLSFDFTINDVDIFEYLIYALETLTLTLTSNSNEQMSHNALFNEFTLLMKRLNRRGIFSTNKWCECIENKYLTFAKLNNMKQILIKKRKILMLSCCNSNNSINMSQFADIEHLIDVIIYKMY